MTQQQDPSWLADGWKVAEIVGGVLMGFLGWVGNRMTARLDSLEKTAVTRDELEEKFKEMREDRKSMHQENTASLRRIEDKLDSTQPGVIASKLIRAEKDIEDLRDWKHSVDPFIERRVEP